VGLGWEIWKTEAPTKSWGEPLAEVYRTDGDRLGPQKLNSCCCQRSSLVLPEILRTFVLKLNKRKERHASAGKGNCVSWRVEYRMRYIDDLTRKHPE